MNKDRYVIKYNQYEKKLNELAELSNGWYSEINNEGTSPSSLAISNGKGVS